MLSLFVRPLIICCLFLPVAAFAATSATIASFTNHPIGIFCLIIFVIAYLFVVLEERIHLPKSKPVVIAAAIIWFAIAIYYRTQDNKELVHTLIGVNLLEYTELLLFLLVAMTYINALSERRLFMKIQSWLCAQGYSYRSLFWMTGCLTFFMSPIADNLTTALVLCTVLLAVGQGEPRFVTLGCINIVVAANAGGAFSPFGDITTLMVWQSGKVAFLEFFALFVPAGVNYLLPAFIMSRSVPNTVPQTLNDTVEVKRGAYRISFLFVFTIVTAVSGHAWLDIPPAIGMMAGLGYLSIFGYYLVRSLPRSLERKRKRYKNNPAKLAELNKINPFNLFGEIARVEWDTLLFFYGVVMCIGGLGAIGYLAIMSQLLYGQLDTTMANALVGVLSAVVDNIPVMFAVLNMNPEMSHGQWLLVTLCAGVGGSLLSVGSAAGVALMGQAGGKYTFLSHLRWTPVIALGYVASIMVHLLLYGV